MLIAEPSDAAAEEAMLALLRGASTAELNDMICGNEMHRLFAGVDDHWFGPHNRDALVQLLARDRRAELSVMSAAGVIYGLQRGWATASDQAAIRDMLLATRGEELTRLKNQINDRVDHYDLEGLVFEHLDAGVRGEVLAHVAAEASGVDTGQAKVLIDIDDTTISSIHERLYPRGTVYPGALELFEGLDLGATPPPFSTDDLIFVTARPTDALGIIHDATSRSLRKAGVAKLAIETGTVLGMFTKRGMADGKLANIRQIRALYPEYRLIFLGDSGQGDVLVADDLLAEHPDAVAFIHDVVDTPEAERDAHAARGVHFFDTYVGAASMARGLGLVSADRLELIAEHARESFNRVRFHSDAAADAARALLERDLAGV